MKKNLHHQKYRVITDINQDTGVTPQQLYDQCQYLIGTMKEAFQLTEEQKSDCLGNTIIYTLRKMNQGILDNKNYDVFKGYMFMTLKNEVLKQLKRQNYNYNKIFNEKSAEMDELNEKPTSENKEQFEIKQAIKTVLEQYDEKDRYILQQYLDGFMYKEISKTTGTPKHKIGALIMDFKQNVKNIYNEEPNLKL